MKARLFKITEEQYKFLWKLIVENNKRPFTDFEKELLKQEIDQAHNLEDFLSVLVTSLFMGRR